jgi:hypothetical protein
MALIGVTELSLSGRGPKRGFVFDAHRLALPCWAQVARGAVLVTLDRHFDTVPPAHLPAPAEGLEAYAHHRLDARNFDHVLAAMDAGIVSDAIVVARTRLPGAVTGPEWTDTRGVRHRLLSAPTVDALDRDAALSLLHAAPATLLDIDLDCFTSPCDADPTTAVPWPVELIRDHVLPRGSEHFWDAALARCAALTFAREPGHCGGLIAAGRLFEAAAQVVFRELLRADLP